MGKRRKKSEDGSDGDQSGNYVLNSSISDFCRKHSVGGWAEDFGSSPQHSIVSEVLREEKGGCSGDWKRFRIPSLGCKALAGKGG